VADLGSRLEPVIEALLEPGEELRGTCVASEVGMLRGRQVAIGVTDRRLLVQGMDRKFSPKGEPISLPPERIADASAEGASGGWVTLGSAFMDRAAVTLRLRTVDGQKLKLMLMRAEGPLKGLGGGETQRRGVEALGSWFGEAGT
jgi:hypothetical protein